MFKIGTLKLSHPYILAPMAGVSDLPFRLFNRKFGCELAFVEMLNVRSLSYKSKKTQHMLSTGPQDRPLGVQLLGCEPKFIQKGLEVINSYQYDLLDFNAGCPAKKVTRRGEGASLLKDPKKLNRLLQLVVKKAKSPVTVKIRIGWDKDSSDARDTALAAEDAGIDALFVHGRFKVQGYSGRVNYEAIKRIKDALKIPLIASGDIFSAELAKEMFRRTNCDAVAVARGALGNPWIFREIEAGLNNKKLPPRPEIKDLVKAMTEHLRLSIDFYGERVGVVIFRKFFNWYTRGLRRIKPLKERSSRAKTAEEVYNLIEQLVILQSR